jgi:hypothetical protein
MLLKIQELGELSGRLSCPLQDATEPEAEAGSFVKVRCRGPGGDAGRGPGQDGARKNQAGEACGERREVLPDFRERQGEVTSDRQWRTELV